jgi:hypothetical protein
MNTYRGKPGIFGPYTLVSDWESRGVLFHNSRLLLLLGDKLIKRYEPHEYPKARDHAIELMLDAGRRKRVGAGMGAIYNLTGKS